MTTKEERQAERARVSKGMGTRDPEKYSTHVSTGFLLRLLDDADAAAAMEQDRDTADERHLDACEKWTAAEKESGRLRAAIGSVLGENKRSSAALRCMRYNRRACDDTTCKCSCCRAYSLLKAALLYKGD